jgi:hypothetical protein
MRYSDDWVTEEHWRRVADCELPVGSFIRRYEDGPLWVLSAFGPYFIWAYPKGSKNPEEDEQRLFSWIEIEED